MPPFQDPVYCVMADTHSGFELANPDVENLLFDFFVRHNLFRALVYPYASDIRRGRRRSHPRHWKVLAELVSIASRDLEVKCDN